MDLRRDEATPRDRLWPLVERMTAWRRDLHAHPELGNEEHRTAAVIAEVLGSAGYAVRRFAGTGVVGTIRAGRSTRAVGLRADIDALPIAETSGVPHASRHPGLMHACGHDGHTAMLLGAAILLAEAPRFDGVVHLIFQPAEEGGGGARRLREAGLFEALPMASVHGLHNWPDLPRGTIAVHGGPVMAACDEFQIRIRGRGGHAALPHKTTEPVLVAGHLITSFQSLVARETDPFDSAVVSVTRLETGRAINAIPEAVMLSGTIRSVRPAVRERVHAGLARIASHGAAAFGATAEMVIEARASATVNTTAEADIAARAAMAVVGVAGVRRDLPPSLTAEDFGDLRADLPGSYVWLGTGPTDASAPPPPGLHDPAYDFDDRALVTGAAYWVALVQALLPIGEEAP